MLKISTMVFAHGFAFLVYTMGLISLRRNIMIYKTYQFFMLLFVIRLLINGTELVRYGSSYFLEDNELANDQPRSPLFCKPIHIVNQLAVTVEPIVVMAIVFDYGLGLSRKWFCFPFLLGGLSAVLMLAKMIIDWPLPYDKHCNLPTMGFAEEFLLYFHCFVRILNLIGLVIALGRMKKTPRHFTLLGILFLEESFAAIYQFIVVLMHSSDVFHGWNDLILTVDLTCLLDLLIVTTLFCGFFTFNSFAPSSQNYSFFSATDDSVQLVIGSQEKEEKGKKENASPMKKTNVRSNRSILPIEHQSLCVSSDSIDLVCLVILKCPRNRLKCADAPAQISPHPPPFSLPGMILDNVVQLIYGIPGVLTYVVVFYAMWSLRKVLSNSFMFLFIMTAVVNIVTFLNTWVYLKLQKEPFFDFYFRWLEEQPVVKQIHVLAVSHFYYAQNIDLLLLTYDRFVTITQLTDTSWWNKYYLLVVVGAQIIICPIHWASRNFPKAALFQSIYGGIISTACLVLNILSMRYLYKMNKSSRTAHMSLFIISFLMLLTQLLNLGIVISTAIGFSNQETLTKVYSVMMYTSDLFSLGQAVYTILLPGPMRHFVAQKITKLLPFCSRHTVTTLTPVSKANISK